MLKDENCKLKANASSLKLEADELNRSLLNKVKIIP